MKTKGKDKLLHKARSEEHNETKTEKSGKNGEEYEKKGEIRRDRVRTSEAVPFSIPKSQVLQYILTVQHLHFEDKCFIYMQS